MKQFAILFSVTLTTWVVHLALVTGYTKLFTNTHSLAFRILYALEITATFSLALGLYLHHVHQAPSLAFILITVFGFLALVDTALSLTVPSVRASFDVWHFIVAYSLLAISLALLYRRLA